MNGWYDGVRCAVCGVRVCGCAGVRVCGCAGVRVCGCGGVMVSCDVRESGV
jgi:hypothetical protein